MVIELPLRYLCVCEQNFLISRYRAMKLLFRDVSQHYFMVNQYNRKENEKWCDVSLHLEWKKLLYSWSLKSHERCTSNALVSAFRSLVFGFLRQANIFCISRQSFIFPLSVRSVLARFLANLFSFNHKICLVDYDIIPLNRYLK